jgi:hypothetical protein
MSLNATPTWLKRLRPGLELDAFHVDPAYFPASTRDVLSVTEIVEHGVLLLGYKIGRRFFRQEMILNIGLVNPEPKEKIKTVEQLVRAKVSPTAFSKIKVYRLVPEEFHRVLKDVYGVKTTKKKEKRA